jgi:peptidoglycan hydrolase-like protein with peptidoglycan-binding domain
MVVAGMPHCPRREDATEDRGPWKGFHDRLYAADQQSFPIFLVTAADAWPRLQSARTGASLAYGSEGEAVKALQRKLAAAGSYRGRVTGRLDARTYRAWKRPRGARSSE